MQQHAGNVAPVRAALQVDDASIRHRDGNSNVASESDASETDKHERHSPHASPSPHALRQAQSTATIVCNTDIASDPIDGHTSTRHTHEVEDDDDAFWDADDGDSSPSLLLLSPPSRHRSTTLDDDHALIDVLATELRTRAIPSYMDAFEIVIPDAEIVVGSVPVSELEQREHDVEAAKLRRAELESELYRQREVQLAQQETNARRRLLVEAHARHDRLEREQLQLVHSMQLRARRLGVVVQQAETHLHDELARQQAFVTQRYGALQQSRVPQSRKRLRVEWQRMPLMLELRMRQLRAVKDKLPRGHYVLVATLYDRLGGHALHYSAWDPESDDPMMRQRTPRRLHKPNFTRPFEHRGRFFHTDVVVNQRVVVVCPPDIALRPAHVLVLELVHLTTKRSSRQQQQQRQQYVDDPVVAWGALPLTTPDASVVSGKFKLPLLRGEMDTTIDKFSDMEQLIESDLSAWLCNLYVDATHLPKRLPCKSKSERSRTDAADQTDLESDVAFDVELDLHSGLVRMENNYERFKRRRQQHNDGRNSTTTLRGQDDNRVDAPSQRLLRSRRHHDATKRSDGDISDDHDRHNDSSNVVVVQRTSLQQHVASRTDDDSDALRYQHPLATACSTLRRTWKRLVQRKKTRIYSGDMIDDTTKRHAIATDACESTAAAAAAETPAEPFASAPAHRPRSDSDDSDSDDSDSDDTATSTLDAASSASSLPPLDTENYHFSVTNSTSNVTATHQRFQLQRKLRFLRHELLADVSSGGGVNRTFHTLECWRSVLLFATALYVRVFVHYTAQWLYLRVYRIPVYDFRVSWTTCVVKYTARSVATRIEVGVVAAGVLGNVALFSFVAVAAAIAQRSVGELPHFASTLIVCIGIAAVLDPLLVFVTDVLLHHYNCSAASPSCRVSLAASSCLCVDGDAFKLYSRFYATEGSGVAGAALTLMLYAALVSVAVGVVYTYVLYVHMNGRMLDIYRRIHSDEHAFFVPHDREVALAELLAICAAAQRWRGPHGTQRKVFVHTYTLTDVLDAAFRETSVHVAVYTLALDGTGRELHRHFLQTPDGAIVELFGAIASGGDGDSSSNSAWLTGTTAAAATATSLAMLQSILHDALQSDEADDAASEVAPEHLAALLDAL